MPLGIKSAFSDYSAPSLCPTQPYKLVSSMKGEYFNCIAKSVSSVSSSHSSDHNGCAVSPPTGFVYCDCDSASVQSNTSAPFNDICSAEGIPSTGKSSNSSSSSRGATGFLVVSSLSLSASLGGMYLRLLDCGLTFDMMACHTLGFGGGRACAIRN